MKSSYGISYRDLGEIENKVKSSEDFPELSPNCFVLMRGVDGGVLSDVERKFQKEFYFCEVD